MDEHYESELSAEERTVFSVVWTEGNGQWLPSGEVVWKLDVEIVLACLMEQTEQNSWRKRETREESLQRWKSEDAHCPRS